MREYKTQIRVHALQWNGYNKEEMKVFLRDDRPCVLISGDISSPIQNLRISLNDWVVVDLETGFYWVEDNETFTQNYQEVGI